MAAWLTAKAPHTDKGKRVGEIAQAYFKQFKHTLHKKNMPFSLRHDLRMLLSQSRKRLLKEDHQKRDYKHNH